MVDEWDVGVQLNDWEEFGAELVVVVEVFVLGEESKWVAEGDVREESRVKCWTFSAKSRG